MYAIAFDLDQDILQKYTMCRAIRTHMVISKRHWKRMVLPANRVVCISATYRAWMLLPVFWLLWISPKIIRGLLLPYRIFVCSALKKIMT